ncbi:acetyl-CoA acetyltransferase [Nocardioides sp. Root1257]|uniref:acetyl-CoA C-acetyltransferase n=1 Tax=unclassified Nocardioides TaxID=2615069 RepID=UPI0006F7AD58|nr:MULTISPECIES: acetyl-CoA C-acetyltransferase [unclassified Nocardioides]KQW45906.1 acetyl-CoA acetyltransferase [Nocardioides sp. Root1257]KRC43171.1 acetyl-CoA acetyltransferase [Nocardioides sp. Root224]
MPGPTSVIVGGARTPIGRLLGALSSVPATELGGIAIKGALNRVGISGDTIDYVVMGQVLQTGAGQNPARTAGLLAGIPGTVPSVTINKVCLSGINAVAIADQLIRSGEAEIVVAGGMESMSRAPHYLPGSRTGYKFGTVDLVDSMAHDGLWDQATRQPMGALAETYLTGHGVTRSDMDEFAARSHRLAAEAQTNGVFDDEIVPVPISTRSGATIDVLRDEGVRPDTTTETLGRLKPAFAADGRITPGSASPISDGAAAMVIMSREKAESLDLAWLAEIVAQSTVAGPDSSLQLQPANATRKALAKAGLTVDDLDVVEINEAFAAVGIETARDLGLSEDRVNVNGGAIAIGHPLGMSGARIVLHLALELRRRGSGIGAAALCGGGGQGDAVVLRVPR